MGNPRIGSSLELEETIFVLMFCAGIKDEIITEYFDIIGGKFWTEDDEVQKARALKALKLGSEEKLVLEEQN